MGERARLFVAAWPPAAVLDVIDALDRPEDPAVRYTTRDQWHVTLRFLGSCAVDDALAAFADIDGVATEARLGPVVSRLGRSVVVVPVGGLDALATAVVTATAHVGEPPETRPFSGHLTVARLRGRPAARIAGQSVEASFPVREVHLVRSDLQRDGARYVRLATRSLAAG
jgi:RNA 2',3'-cyclic 3'-phosphodiesterase